MIEGENGILAKWNLLEKPRVYVTDNASNVKACVELSGKEWLGFFTHTLNLSVAAGFKGEAISKVIAEAKTLVQFIHKSSVARDILKKFYKQ